jgi:hypothetical protein
VEEIDGIARKTNLIISNIDLGKMSIARKSSTLKSRKPQFQLSKIFRKHNGAESILSSAEVQSLRG